MVSESQAQPQQSWAAWILDAYADAAVTSHEDLTDSDYSEALSPTMSETSTSGTTSPYGPYVRTGRGGAGNFQWQSQQTGDLEAQKPMSLKEKRNVALIIETIDTKGAMKNAQTRKPSPFTRVGRGGAGNFGPLIQSNEPQPSPTTTNFTRSPSATSSPVFYSGRGGAGNFGAGKSAAEQARLNKEKQDLADAERRREEATQKVESMLQPPSQAYIGSRRRSVLPEDLEGATCD